jgi:NAD(P)-dependent dehydrogenase (short-subunit alcohol dehydrogenase family)
MHTQQKVGIVTGGASGIGKAISEELISRSVYVIIIDVNPVEGEQAAADIINRGGSARFLLVDVTDAKQMHETIHSIYDEFGRIDYMFNNAGVVMYGELQDMTDEHWKHIFDINLWGVINGTRAAYSIMKKQGFGCIANTSSASGLGPTPMVTAYAATKHAVVGLTTSLHYEAEAYGVKVYVLCPGHVDTAIYERGAAIGLDKMKINEQVRKHKMMTPRAFAAFALKRLERNDPIVCPIPLRKTTNLFFNLFPSAHRKLMRMVCRIFREAKIN